MGVGERRQAASGTPKWLVVCVHGYGSRGAELISLADYWASSLPDAAFFAPDGPIVSKEPEGGRAWFPKRSPGAPELPGEVAAAAPVLEELCAAELARLELGADRLALVGFSQGTVLSLQLGLRSQVAPVAVLGFAGGLIGPERLQEEIQSRPPVMLINGEQDPLAPVFGMRVSVKALQEAGVVAHGEALPGLGHVLDANGLILGGRFLLSAMAYAERQASEK